jgi:hypothetical protein
MVGDRRELDEVFSDDLCMRERRLVVEEEEVEEEEIEGVGEEGGDIKGAAGVKEDGVVLDIGGKWRRFNCSDVFVLSDFTT